MEEEEEERASKGGCVKALEKIFIRNKEGRRSEGERMEATGEKNEEGVREGEVWEGKVEARGKKGDKGLQLTHSLPWGGRRGQGKEASKYIKCTNFAVYDSCR